MMNLADTRSSHTSPTQLLLATVVSVLLLSAAAPLVGIVLAVEENPAGEGVIAGPPHNTILGTPVPLQETFRLNVQGDYVAAGVGLRNTGSGSISIGLPAGSTVVKSFLYWASMDFAFSSALASGTYNGNPITGTLVGQTANPCWFGTIFVFRADVTSLGVGPTNTVSFASGVSGPSPGNVVPFPATPPLLEGASLAVVFSNPSFAFREVIIHDGAVTTVFPPPVSTTFTFPAAFAPVAAKTSWIVADGQHNLAGLNNRILVDGTEIANHVLDGAGPGTQLWDTRTDDISAFVPLGDTAVTVAIESNADFGIFDCLTWVAQAFSVTKLDVEKDCRFTDVDFESGELGDLLPTAHGNHFRVDVNVHPRKDTVQNTNPGQFYCVVSIRGLGLESFWFHEAFDDQFDVNPAKLGGGIEVIVVDGAGVVTVLTDILKDVLMVSWEVNNDDGEVWLDVDVLGSLGGALAADETLMIYTKFGPSPDFKGVLSPGFPDHWENWAFVDLDHNPPAEYDEHATIHLEEK